MRGRISRGELAVINAVGPETNKCVQNCKNNADILYFNSTLRCRYFRQVRAYLKHIPPNIFGMSYVKLKGLMDSQATKQYFKVFKSKHGSVDNEILYLLTFPDNH